SLASVGDLESSTKSKHLLPHVAKAVVQLAGLKAAKDELRRAGSVVLDHGAHFVRFIAKANEHRPGSRMLGDVDECLPNDRMDHAGHPGDRRARVPGHHKIG